MCAEYEFEKERNENKIVELVDKEIEKMGLQDEAIKAVENMNMHHEPDFKWDGKMPKVKKGR